MMNMFFTPRTLIVQIMMISFFMASCKKEKEKEEDPTPTPAPTAPVESYDMKVDGTNYSGTFIEKTYNAEQNHMNLVTDCGNSVLAEFEVYGNLSPGNQTINSSSTNIGFIIAMGATAYYCSNCTVTIETHNTDTRYFKCKITGTLTQFLGSATKTLNEARFSVYY